MISSGKLRAAIYYFLYNGDEANGTHISSCVHNKDIHYFNLMMIDCIHYM